MSAARVTHRRLEPRARSAVGPWWAKAWMRAVEEVAFSEADLRAGNRLARAGMVGAISVEPGSVLAAVREGDDAWTVTVDVPVLEPAALATFVEVVATAARRLGDLLAGELPHQLVEDAEEAGVELLPYGGELDAGCTCDAPLDPCPHALAVLVQLAWLQAADPLVLLLLRGLPREDLVAAVHDLSEVAGAASGEASGGSSGEASGAPRAATDEGAMEVIDPVDIAADAALHAARLLAALDRGAC